MLELYIANKNYSSWSLRPWVLMKVLGIPFVEKMNFFAGEKTPIQFRLFSPTGQVPVLVDGHQSIWDSLAIVEFLAERHDRVWPRDPVARAWGRSAAAEMHAGFRALRNDCSMNIGVRMALHQKSRPLLSDLERLDQLWQDGLSRFQGPWLAGENFTAVDAFYAPVAFRLQTYGLELSPTSQAHANRLLALPALQEWQAQALLEVQRDEPHEAEMRLVGTILEDKRRS